MVIRLDGHRHDDREADRQECQLPPPFCSPRRQHHCVLSPRLRLSTVTVGPRKKTEKRKDSVEGGALVAKAAVPSPRGSPRGTRFFPKEQQGHRRRRRGALVGNSGLHRAGADLPRLPRADPLRMCKGDDDDDDVVWRGEIHDVAEELRVAALRRKKSGKSWRPLSFLKQS